MKRDLAVVIAIGIALALFFAFVVPDALAGETASVWDGRDPAVVRTEGIVEGITQNTFPTMMGFKDLFAERLRRSPDAALEARLREYAGKMESLRAYLLALVDDPELGKTIGEDHPKMRKLRVLIREATDVFFILARGITAPAS